MTGYRKSVRAETGLDNDALREAVKGAARQVPWLQSTAANAQSVDRAVDHVLRQIGASKTSVNESALRPGEQYEHPVVGSLRIGASTEGIPGELSVHRITHSQPPAVIVTGWLR